MPKCTYCGSSEFLEGPSGGMSTNLLCANNTCRHWFNYTEVVNTLDDLHRVEPTADQAAIKRSEDEAARDAETVKRFEEGREAFLNATPIGTCYGRSEYGSSGKTTERKGKMRGDYSYGGYAEPSSNIDRLVGYIEAMADEVRRLRLLVDQK